MLSISLLIGSGSAAERDTLSYVSQVGMEGPTYLTLIDTTGKVHRDLLMSDLKRLTSVAWSPDGRSFVCSSDRGGNFDIYVVDVRADKRRQLTFDGNRDLEPAWSPNGKWIAFISDRGGKPDIYRMDVDGGNVRQLTDIGHCRSPAWSPDSRWIAFTAAPERSTYTLFVMNADGKRTSVLKKHIPFPGCTWSPNGKEIAFIARDIEGKYQVSSINVKEKKLRQFTWLDQHAFIFEPVWSPSGKWIAYTSWEVPKVFIEQQIEFTIGTPLISIVDTAGNGRERRIESTSGAAPHALDWVPEAFFDVAPSVEKLITVWAEIK